MKEEIALITSDWHLNNEGKILPKYNLIKDFEFSLEQIAQKLNQHKDIDMFLLGDIFDKPLINANVINLIKEFDSYLKRRVTCYFILGQHDPKPPILDSVKTQNIDFVYSNQKIIEYKNIKILMLDYLHKTESNEVLLHNLLCNNEIDIFMTHQVWKEFLPLSENCWSAESLFKENKFKTIITGDYHKPDYKNFIVSGERRNILSCGSIVFTDFGLCLPYRSYLMLYKDEDDVKFEHKQIKTRMIFKFKIFNDEDFIKINDVLDRVDSYTKELPEYMKKGVFIFELSPSIFEKKGKEINERLRNHHISIFIKNRLSKDFSFSELSKKSRLSFESAISEYCKINDLVDVEGDCIALWRKAIKNREDEELERIFKESKNDKQS